MAAYAFGVALVCYLSGGTAVDVGDLYFLVVGNLRWYLRGVPPSGDSVGACIRIELGISIHGGDDLENSAFPVKQGREYTMRGGR